MGDPNKRQHLGTKQVGEGIDVKELQAVLKVDYSPEVIEYIQRAGRLRSAGTARLVI